jgi:hypothetical protein
MDPERFDRLAASFGKRISRRDAMKTGVIGVGGVTLAGVTSSTLAHDATPEASPVALDTDTNSFMFVQTFGAGSIDAATDGVETLLPITSPARRSSSPTGRSASSAWCQPRRF